MSSEPSIRCAGVGKAFQLYAHQNDQLKQVLFGLWKKFYTDKWVLHDVNFTVEQGRARRHRSGATAPARRRCCRFSAASPCRRRATFEVNGRIAPILALGSGFDGLLTGRENARIGAAILGLSRKEVDARIDRHRRLRGHRAVLRAADAHLFHGHGARVAFAICAHADADILIVDEALSVGDEMFQRKCERYIAEFAKTGTILMVSHDLNFLADLCDRVLWLENGVVREIGEPRRSHRRLSGGDARRRGKSGRRRGVAPARTARATRSVSASGCNSAGRSATAETPISTRTSARQQQREPAR